MVFALELFGVKHLLVVENILLKQLLLSLVKIIGVNLMFFYKILTKHFNGCGSFTHY